jgi:fumarylacetoacetase
MNLDHTHADAASSWVAGAGDHPHFPVQNLPLGVFSRDGGQKRVGCAIGDFVLDLHGLADRADLLPGVGIELAETLRLDTLNALFSLPPSERIALRHALFALLTSEEHRTDVSHWLYPVRQCALHLPFRVGDYTDFYVGIHHATNIGKVFRPDSPLLPNYKHIPIGYHGRASSVRPSGTPVVRPSGQLKAPDAEVPHFAPAKRLDYEMELGVWIAGDNELGVPVPITDAWSRIAGLCILNDWSARDIQAWEYQPLGPFLAKSFLTTVSPWVVTAEALAPFRIASRSRPEGDPAPLPYLVDAADRESGNLALDLEVSLSTSLTRDAGLAPQRLSHGPASNMYWTVAQMIAHHTSNGCDLHAGDLLGTGTISGATADALGSLMEISAGGKQPIVLANGEQRCFLEDGDEVSMSVIAVRDGFRSIGFGSCTGTVVPASHPIPTNHT